MAQAHLGLPSPSLSLLGTDGGVLQRSAVPLVRLSSVSSNGFSRSASSFRQGTPLVVSKKLAQRVHQVKVYSMPIRCEQSAQEGGGLDVWLGRLAMVGFASAITVEIVTGKGLLENFGLTTPLPTAALAVTGLVGALTAFFIFQSASKD